MEIEYSIGQITIVPDVPYVLFGTIFFVDIYYGELGAYGFHSCSCYAESFVISGFEHKHAIHLN